MTGLLKLQIFQTSLREETVVIRKKRGNFVARYLGFDIEKCHYLKHGHVFVELERKLILEESLS
jgi:3-methyladenine DNA glycosylase Tag